MNAWQGVVFEYTAHVFVFLADTQHYVPMKLMGVMGNPRDFPVRILLKSWIYPTRNLLWDTLEINWFSVLLKLSES